MYCAKCGRVIDDNCSFCSACGYQMGTIQYNDAPNAGFAVLGFFIPLVGLILYLVYESKQPLKAKSAGKGALIGFISSIVVSIIATILMLAGTFAFLDKYVPTLGELYSYSDDIYGDKTEEILEKYLDVNIGKFIVKKGDFIDETKLDITVKNKGDKKSTFYIKIEAVDKNGARLDTATIFAQDLNGGQSMTLKAFEFVLPEQIEELKNATFKVLEISKY